MWCFTKTGFYSAVEHRDGPEWLLVRCRTEADAQALSEFAKDRQIATRDSVYARVEEDPKADYRWRVKVWRYDFEKFLDAAVQDIDYDTSVKDHIDKGEPARHAALLQVWTALMRLQTAEQFGVTATDNRPLADIDHEAVWAGFDHEPDVYNDVTPESLTAWLDDAEGAGLDAAGTAEALLKHFEMYRIE